MGSEGTAGRAQEWPRAGTAGNGAARPAGEVVVIGAGPSGLACAHSLQRVGLAGRVLEHEDRVASTWHGYYDGLRLNSGRIVSSLPGMLIDRRFGPFVRREDFIDYLDRYADRVEVPIEFGVEVRRLDRADGGWLVRTASGDRRASAVIVATGVNRVPVRPAWARATDFDGELLYARDYRNPLLYRGLDVLVVGSGATANDIVLQLAAGGAARLRISVRTPPILVPKTVLGLSSAWLSQAMKHGPKLPDSVQDRLSLLLQRIYFPDAVKYLGAPPTGVRTALNRRGHGAAIEVGLLDVLRRGRATVVPAVEELDRADVVLAGGQRIQPDVVIVATGQRPGLEPLVGHLGVLGPDGRPVAHGARTAPGAPGLHFVGYRLPSGQLPDLRLDAPAIARKLAKTRRHSTAVSA